MGKLYYKRVYKEDKLEPTAKKNKIKGYSENMSAGTKRISNGDNTTATEETNDVDTAIVDGGPGLVYMPFVVMEDLLDKLKLLNYEEVSQPNFFQTCIHSHYT